MLASVEEHAGLSPTWSHNSKDRFSHEGAHEPRHKKTCPGICDQVYSNWPARLWRLARGLIFCIYKLH